MAGYSKRTLVDKLGIKPGMTMLIAHAPEGYAATLGSLPDGVTLMDGPETNLDFIHLFAVSRAELEAQFPMLKNVLQPAGMLWVSWPKKASGVITDLHENAVREVGLSNGLVDVKVAAVDEVWSGLKFVYRLEDR